MSLYKCQFIKAVPVSSVFNRCWTHQLLLKLVFNYPTRGYNKKMCSHRQICPLGCHCSDETPHLYAELQGCAGQRLMPRTLQWTGSCSVQPHCSWKKPNSLILVSFCTSSIILKSSLWCWQVTEAVNGLRSAAKVGMREEGISQQVFWESISEEGDSCTGSCVPHVSTHAIQAFAMQWDYWQWDFLFQNVFTVVRHYSLLKKLWNWSPLKKKKRSLSLLKYLTMISHMSFI